MNNSQKILASYLPAAWPGSLFLICCSLFFISKLTVAQTKLKDTVIVDVIKAFQPTIVDAVKINDSPVITDTTKKIPSLDYTFLSKKVNTFFDIDPIKPAKMVGEPLTKLYKSLLKAGLGNYSTPYGEFFYNNLRSKDYSYGTHFKHISSTATLKNYGFSGYSDNEISIYGKKFLKKQTLQGDVDYSRNVVHYYGYDINLFALDKDLTKQRFSFINPKLQLTSHYNDSSKMNHHVKLNYYNLADSYQAVENNISADAMFSGYIEKELFTLKSVVDHYNNKTTIDTTNNTIVRLTPSVLSKGDKWKASIGIIAVADFNTNNTFHFYPNIDFNYHIIDNIFVPYAGVSGGWNKNSFKSLSDINPFIISNVVLKNTDTKYELYAGIRGTLEASTSFNVKGSFSRIYDAPFFTTNVTELLKNKFDIIYDDITFFNLSGEIAYQKSEKMRILLKGDYNKYSMTREIAAWYKPEMTLTMSGNYNFKDKIVAKAAIFILSKQYAKIVTTTGLVSATSKKELKGMADINLGAEYRYTKKLSAFITLHNLASFRYYRWNNYPTQRFNFLVGFTYAF